MEITKTPVEIIQQLIAIHTTRKEAVDKLKTLQLTGTTGDTLTAAAQQSDEFIAEWMSELSTYGDAVMASVDREDEYQGIWKGALGKMDSMTQQEGEQTFHSLEDSLKRVYQDTIQSHTDLPASVAEILNSQSGKL